MLTILALKPSLVGVLLILGVFAFFAYLRYRIVDPVFARQSVFVLFVLLLDAFLGLVIWGAAYSKLDYVVLAVYLSALGSAIAVLVPSTKSSPQKNASDDVENPVAANKMAPTSKPDWFYRYAIQCPTNLFFPESLSQAVKKIEDSKIVIIGPYGSGKETLGLRWASDRCAHVIRPSRFALREIMKNPDPVNDPQVAIILRDLQTFGEVENKAIEKLSELACKFVLTTTNVDILDDSDVYRKFQRVYVPQLKPSEIEPCFKFFFGDLEIEEVDWAGVAKLLKICYVPTIKYISEITIQQMSQDETASRKVKRIHLASALQKFLNEPM